MNKPAIKLFYLSPVAPRPGHEELFAEMAKSHKWPETEAHVACMPTTMGRLTHVEFRAYEAVATPYLVRAVRAAAREGFDACVIGCFYDTALEAAREVSGDMIVTAPCEASCDIAATLANRFGIIVGRQKWVHQMERTVHRLGYGARLTGFYPAGLGVTEFQTEPNRTADCLRRAADRAVNRDHAEALILGCTMEIGFHKVLEAEFGVPVIDPSSAAFLRAQHFAYLKRAAHLRPSRKWSCEAPSEDALVALDVFDRAPFFANRITLPANQQERSDD
ncbi:aspartate/glutamate racemase family protein [Ruegeria sp. HKCCD7255]|uniref:aspartate/glutamate racemase family protein n=1 Tax=Ruegeria sp. HKCCD7255 TaxID=2683004 RepID=UPI0014898671|nr:aspartate/glutamate racemase family protein [Ruegeria sp. HKCCD7255]